MTIEGGRQDARPSRSTWCSWRSAGARTRPASGSTRVGVALDKKGRIEVDEHFRTSVAGIYAIGDVIRGPMLAHKAEDEGVACVEMLAGQAGHVNYEAVPSVVYTWPEFASRRQVRRGMRRARHAR